jgi:hypothetical protein
MMACSPAFLAAGPVFAVSRWRDIEETGDIAAALDEKFHLLAGDIFYVAISSAGELDDM